MSSPGVSKGISTKAGQDRSRLLMARGGDISDILHGLSSILYGRKNGPPLLSKAESFSHLFLPAGRGPTSKPLFVPQTKY